MAFTGIASYDDFAVLQPDVSELLLLVAPREVPLLDLLPQAARAATNVDHTWIEQTIGPDRIVASVAVNSATAATGIQIGFTSNEVADGAAGPGNLLSVGMILELEASVSGINTGNQELVQISSIAGANSILVNRNVGGGFARGASSLVAGGTLFVVSTAELEGDDTDGDKSRVRTMKHNYTQIFKKPVKVSGTRESIVGWPNVTDEREQQVTLRTIELLRDLEKAVIRGVAVNSIAADDTYRTMNGMRALITAINSTVVHSSFAADPLGYLNNLMLQAWSVGARDIDVLLCGHQWSAAISATNASKFVVSQSDSSVQRYVDTISTDYGTMRKVVSPWMPPYSVMGLATRRIFVPNLRGRAFTRQVMGTKGDYTLEHIIGEYTLELHQQNQMFQAHA